MKLTTSIKTEEHGSPDLDSMAVSSHDRLGSGGDFLNADTVLTRTAMTGWALLRPR